MTRQALLSAYTPSNMDPQLLKRIFVQRERLLERIVARFATSMSTGDKHHVLLVGPRGSGKTHMVSLIHWELSQMENLADSMRVAWLGEDDTFSGLIHFAFGIAKSLACSYPDEFPQDFKSPVRGLPQDEAAIAVLNSVLENLKHRHLLLITENLDLTFRGIGDAGQKKLRAFLQETRRIATLATTQQLFDGVSNRKESFFGFFDTFHLASLTVQDAEELIRKIAVEQNHTELVQYLDTAQARYRIRAIHHLAGGNHRMYVLLAEFLTREKLDDLVSALETLADELTPYFQERMRSLPDQQRQLVQTLCDAEGAMTVKQLAEETFIAENVCSKQLGNLKSKGYVQSEKRGKESYYDMAEPLMRLCLEVKNQRGNAMRLVARFLKAWFPTEKLQVTFEGFGDASRAGLYCRLALQMDHSFLARINETLKSDIEKHIQAKDWRIVSELADQLNVAEPNVAVEYSKLAELQTSIESHTAVIESPDASGEQKTWALFCRATAYMRLRNFEAALFDIVAAPDVPDAPKDAIGWACFFRGIWNLGMKNADASYGDFSAVIVAHGIPEYLRTAALFTRPEAMFAFKPLEEVVSELTEAFEHGTPKEFTYGNNSKSFIAMVLKRTVSEWAEYVTALAPLYIRYGVADKLGQGLTQSIELLDEGDFTASQLDQWVHVWSDVGEDCEALEIPLACLRAAVQVLKSKPATDRPLFQLPLEIRELIRPLLRKTLGE